MKYYLYGYGCYDYVTAKERMKRQKRQIAENNRRNTMKYRSRYE
jgi:hypothetical protein